MADYPIHTSKPPGQIFEGRNYQAKLLGKRHINGQSFVEIYKGHIVGSNDETTFADVIESTLDDIANDTEIPVDLLEGFEFRLLP